MCLVSRATLDRLVLMLRDKTRLESVAEPATPIGAT